MLRLAVLSALGVAIVAFVMLEGRRQERKLGRRSRGTALMREGLLELQGHLEPHRKVEVVREQARREHLLVELDENGEPPKTPR